MLTLSGRPMQGYLGAGYTRARELARRVYFGQRAPHG